MIRTSVASGFGGAHGASRLPPATTSRPVPTSTQPAQIATANLVSLDISRAATRGGVVIRAGQPASGYESENAVGHELPGTEGP